ncbi:MAG: MutL protein [Firmicutes bacterium]|jgi:uncharacterized protein (TIGR01319 family)|nr:MutL protein [Bacillota bacterium]
MQLIVLIDIGSTFTKVSAVDLDEARLAAHFQAPTTPRNVNDGLQAALTGLGEELAKVGVTSADVQRAQKLACSSAAGGLQMIAIGLVTDLTAEAARQAALGAGARVLKTYAYELTEADRDEIARLQPDIILLAGGTDGGNYTTIIHNAKVLAALDLKVPVVIAGNRSVAPEVAAYLKHNFSTYITANVMPEIGRLDVEPARQVIRQVFMETIVQAKGLSKAEELIDGIFMPTPAAVLRAGTILSQGIAGHTGWGDLVIVDVGGATTDVHSLGSGQPSRAGTVMRGLPEPFAKRTVEGDLGVRVSASPLVEAVGADVVSSFLGWEPERVRALAARITAEQDFLPQTPDDVRFDQALGYFATKAAVSRHAGRISEVYTPTGPVWIQEGKDLSQFKAVIATGGVFINSSAPAHMLAGAAKEASNPFELKPIDPTYYLDSDYLLAAAGLLAEEYGQAAFRLMERSLKCVR